MRTIHKHTRVRFRNRNGQAPCVCKFSYRAGQVVDLPRPSWRPGRPPDRQFFFLGGRPPPLPEKKVGDPTPDRVGEPADGQQPVVSLVGKAMGLPSLARPVGQPTWPPDKKNWRLVVDLPHPKKKVGRVGAGKKNSAGEWPTWSTRKKKVGGGSASADLAGEGRHRLYTTARMCIEFGIANENCLCVNLDVGCEWLVGWWWTSTAWLSEKKIRRAGGRPPPLEKKSCRPSARRPTGRLVGGRPGSSRRSLWLAKPMGLPPLVRLASGGPLVLRGRVGPAWSPGKKNRRSGGRPPPSEKKSWRAGGRE